MATAAYGGNKPPVVLTLSETEARALLADLGDYEYALSLQSDAVRRALENLLEG